MAEPETPIHTDEPVSGSHRAFSADDIPERIKLRPTYGAHPVPFTTWRNPTTDVPDFRVIDTARQIEAIEHRLCGICGQKMDYWVAFIGGPMAIAARQFRDPAMHDDCARFAAIACPFLNGRQHEMRDGAEEKHPGLVEHDDAIAGTLEKTLLYRTRSYDWRVVEKHGVVIFAAPAKHIEVLRG